jgi:hypothetical protein
MSAQGRVFREFDGLPTLITLSLCFDNPLLKGFNFLLSLLELLLLLIQLGLEFGQPLAEFADFSPSRHVILSAAKDLVRDGRFFAAFRTALRSS